MNKNTLLVCGLILAVTFMLPGAGFAADEPKKQSAKKKTPVELQQERTQSLTHKMMGNINLAQFALGLKLPDDAAHHIEKAQAVEAELAEQLPELTVKSSFKYGKVTYDDISTIKEHYVPVENDVLVSSDYEAIFERSKELGLKETSAGIVQITVSVDLREVKKGLDAAHRDIDRKDYGKAQNALAAVFQDAIVNEEEIDDPILAISGNLALAKSFLNIGQYDKARFTLQYVQERLASASTSNVSLSGVDRATVKNLSADLDKLKAELRKEDPTLTQRISDQLDHWKKTVEEWID
ncbi:YfdX protein [Nitrosomonas sp. Nm51]|uniref:YfdX family protein n=1 Tax=Nitrosomonas sp. Nm51 TaxID=133720 RepID=UPI0008D4C965|nr:YfdX family protein [Nitrosomonas sp. Nm51]SEQ91256.1 YfdX protein [Nitrosomonas sp. Nm51]